LAIRHVFEDPTICRLPVGEATGWQPALQKAAKAARGKCAQIISSDRAIKST
jgi:hypothetical protein